MIPFRLTTAAIAALAAACAFATTAHAAPRGACAQTGYSYAGAQTLVAARGLSARVTATRTAVVTSGHVAAWIGVSGQAGWLQIGISSVPGGTTELYYEASQPGSDPVYTSLGAIGTGETHQISVVETGTPDVWVVNLDGQTVSGQILLRGSHDSWRPMATSESYDGGMTACNAYGFRFGNLQTASAAGVWQPLKSLRTFADAGHALRATAFGGLAITRG
jgi:hypothetical protein